MLTDNVEQLVIDLGGSFCCDSGTVAGKGLTCAALRRPLLHLLAQGEPVSIESLAAHIEHPPAAVVAGLRSMNVEYDKEGNIVAAALSVLPTPHKVFIDGRTLYTWCALDALMYLPLLARPVGVESPGKATGAPVRMTVTSQDVRDIRPETAVVSLVKPKADRWIRDAFCNDVHFFSSEDAAAPWLARHEAAVVLPVVEAFVVGQRLLQQCC